MHQRRHLGAEQGLRPQRIDAERAMLQEHHSRAGAVDETRQEQCVRPHREADQHPAHGAARRRSSPDQPAKKRWSELGDGRERQQADGRQLGRPERAEVEIGHDHDGEDRNAADLQHEAAEILVGDPRIARQDQRDDQIVRHHDRQRHAFDDDHGGRRRQAADENNDAEQRDLAFHRQGQHEHIAVDEAERERHQSREGDRDHEQIDGDQVKRKQPSGAGDFSRIGVLDNADVKLARQKHDGQERQQHHGQEVADRWRIAHRPHRLRCLHGLFDQFHRPEHPEGHEGAGGQEGDELDDRLGRDREHQAVLVFGGVGLSRPEQHGERRHRQRHDQCNVADDGQIGDGVVFAHDGFEGRADGLELQRDVRHRSDDGDDCDGGGHRLAFAVARRDKVGDRSDVLGLGELDYPAQQRRAERDEDDGSDVDREKVDAVSGGESNRAEERPGRAVNRQRERIDQAAAAFALLARSPVAVAGDQKQEADIPERGCDHAPIVQHCACLIAKWDLAFAGATAPRPIAVRSM